MFDNEVRQLSELPCTALNILVMTGSNKCVVGMKTRCDAKY